MTARLKGRELLVSEWVRKAADDELSAKDILTDREGAPGTVCFLSQQIAEKYLKGFLVFRGKDFPKVHQLDQLVRLCSKVDVTFMNLMDGAKFLTEFYVTTRYPGDYPEFTWDIAEQAFEAAIKVKRFVSEKIKSPL